MGPVDRRHPRGGVFGVIEGLAHVVNRRAQEDSEGLT